MIADTPHTAEPTASSDVSFGFNPNARPSPCISASASVISIATSPRLIPPSRSTSPSRKREPSSTIPTFSQKSYVATPATNIFGTRPYSPAPAQSEWPTAHTRYSATSGDAPCHSARSTARSPCRAKPTAASSNSPGTSRSRRIGSGSMAFAAPRPAEAATPAPVDDGVIRRCAHRRLLTTSPSSKCAASPAPRPPAPAARPSYPARVPAALRASSPLAPSLSSGVLYLVTHGIFLPVRALKVSQFRVELGETKQMPRRRAGCDRAFGLQSLLSLDQCVIARTVLQPNPAQQVCNNTARRFGESSTYPDGM